jgi:hypothetical protein
MTKTSPGQAKKWIKSAAGRQRNIRLAGKEMAKTSPWASKEIYGWEGKK